MYHKVKYNHVSQIYLFKKNTHTSINIRNFFLSFLCELTSHSSMNKMTPENLAIVFGPTLLHAESQIQDLGLALRHIKISQMAVRVLINEHQLKSQSVQPSGSSSSSASEIEAGISLRVSADILSRGAGRSSAPAANITVAEGSEAENEISSRISADILSRGSGRISGKGGRAKSAPSEVSDGAA